MTFIDPIGEFPPKKMQETTSNQSCLTASLREAHEQHMIMIKRHLSPIDGPKNVMLSVNPRGDVIIGSSVTFTCSSSGSNPPIQSYIFFKDNTMLVAERERMTNLTISSIKPSDSGTYHCQAKNNIDGVYSPGVRVDVKCEFWTFLGSIRALGTLKIE